MNKEVKRKQSPLQRINKVMKFYALRGCNSERANEVQRKIIDLKFKDTCANHKE